MQIIIPKVNALSADLYRRKKKLNEYCFGKIDLGMSQTKLISLCGLSTLIIVSSVEVVCCCKRYVSKQLSVRFKNSCAFNFSQEKVIKNPFVDEIHLPRQTSGGGGLILSLPSKYSRVCQDHK